MQDRELTRLAAARADAALHASWLRQKGIPCQAARVTEAPYTGLILAGLLESQTRQPVVDALLAGSDQALLGAVGNQPLLSVGMPSTVADLVLAFGSAQQRRAVVMEHKRFTARPNEADLETHQHLLDAAYQADGSGTIWQTDLAYYGTGAPSWLGGLTRAEVTGFVVLDALGRTMDEMFPVGRSNQHWHVTSYAQFGQSLRSSCEAGCQGLTPLLSTLYAHEKADALQARS
jgi:hypothetical protein